MAKNVLIGGISHKSKLYSKADIYEIFFISYWPLGVWRPRILHLLLQGDRAAHLYFQLCF